MRSEILDKINNQSRYNLFYLIRSDLKRFDSFITALGSIGFWTVFFYRLSHFFHSIHIDIIGCVVQIVASLLTGADISRKLIAGPNLTIFHPSGVYVGPYTKFGQGVMLGAGCFVGALNQSTNPDNYPVLDDYVNISTGAKILGGLAIGERAVVGPNAVVMKNIPANHTVLPVLNSVIKRCEMQEQP
jgi:serine O-acetyltransferase